MSRSSLEAAIPRGAQILLDTSVVLAYLNGREAISPAATLVIDEFVSSGRNHAIVSAVTAGETLIRPMNAGPAAVNLVESFLLHFPNLTLAAVDYAVAREAARIRAGTGLKTPDSLIIASALDGITSIVVANDEQWAGAIAKAAPSLTLCHLDAHVPL
jgi:predicted nucleic acid-binding protein